MKIILLSIAMFSFTALLNAQESDSKKSDKKELAPKKDKTKKQKSPVTFKTLLIQRDAIPYDSQELFIFEFKIHLFLSLSKIRKHPLEISQYLIPFSFSSSYFIQL